MIAVLLSALLHTTPPLVQGPEVELPPPPVPVEAARPRGKAGLRRPVLGLYFSPVSLFSLSAWVEADVPLVGGLDVFANLGGGPLGQLGFDAGLRYYVLGTPLEGFYLDARVSGFALPEQALFMLGPALLVGHAWRISGFILSLGLGTTSWYAVSRSNGRPTFFGTGASEADLLVFPGLSQPPVDRPAVQPTLRLSLGTWF